MKQISQSIISLFLMAFMYASGGAMLYSHYCATTNVTTVTAHKVECEMEKQEKSSCHASNEEKDPCCTDTAEFQTNDQVVNKIVDFNFFVSSITSSPLQGELKRGCFNPTLYSYKIYPRPPNLRACIRFQQVLC